MKSNLKIFSLGKFLGTKAYLELKEINSNQIIKRRFNNIFPFWIKIFIFAFICMVLFLLFT